MIDENGFRIPTGPRSCIWCGSREKMTDEHVVGNWISKLIATRPDAHLRPKEVERRSFFIDREGSLTERHKIQSYCPGQTTNPRVCLACNGGWLEKIQSTAKPVMSPLIMGDFSPLSDDELNAISRWAIMSSINLADLYHHSTIDQIDRLNFRIGNYGINVWNVFGGVSSQNSAIGTMHRVMNPIQEIITFELGNLVLHVIFVKNFRPNSDIVPAIDTYAKNFGIVPIFPKISPSIDWNDAAILTEKDVLNLASYIWAGKKNIFR